MPELPEVETVRLTLAPAVGAVIRQTRWSGLGLRLGKDVDIASLSRACKAARLEAVRRLGKYLLLDLEERRQSVLVHLGMSGRLRIFAAGEMPPPHTHVEWQLSDGRWLRFSDPRRFGQVELVTRGKERTHPALARLGPDPLVDGLHPDALHESCRHTTREIKVALLDQKLVAGVGNIYASEALHRAGIHPTRAANSLSKARAARLAAAIEEVLRDALGHGGTSLRDFVAADGHAGEHSHYLRVYDRTGAPCPTPRCSGRIRRMVQGQRATYYCPRCQR